MYFAHVKMAFEILRELKLFIKLSKCAFGHQEIKYLGYILTNEGVKVDQKKIRAMTEWHIPAISDLRDFLGLAGYYRNFVRNYGMIAHPITNLLRKGQFSWTGKAKEAFQVLKKAMTCTPTLAMPNFNESLVIELDALGNGIGAVLSQQGKPIAYMSRAFGVSKKSGLTYTKEMLAIVQAIQTWRPYLPGRKFYIQNDHRSLKYLMEQRIVTHEQQKRVSKLLGYNYEISYKPGRENLADDALSRVVFSPLSRVDILGCYAHTKG